MNKRLIIIILLIAVFVLVTVGALLLFVGNGNQEPENPSVPSSQTDPLAEQKELTSINSVEEFKNVLSNKNYEYGLAPDNSGGTIFDINFLSKDAYVTYYFDKEGKTTDFTLTSYFNLIGDEEAYEIEEIDRDSLAVKTYAAVNEFCSMFDFDGEVDLYLTNDDGTFTKIESDEDFQGILDGRSYLDFSIRDVDGYYWLMRVTCDGELAWVNVFKYFDVEMYLDYFANISLYEEDE